MRVKVERILKRLSDRARSAFDTKLVKVLFGSGRLTVDAVHLEREIDGLVRTVNGRRVAPNLFTVRVPWDTHSTAPSETLKDLEYDVTAISIDHINNQLYQTNSPVRVTVVPDIYVTGIIVEPSFGCAEPDTPRAGPVTPLARASSAISPVRVLARVEFPDGEREIRMSFWRSGERLTVGRAEGNALHIDHESIANVHAVLTLSRSGSIAVCDTGSGLCTLLNGRRLVEGEVHGIGKRDVLTFGRINTRLRIVEQQ